MNQLNSLTIGLFGFGVVGQGLYDVLHRTKGVRGKVKKIAIKHLEKKRSLDAGLFTDYGPALLEDPEINVIVELINNADEAFQIVKTALERKKAVVTANKKMIATHFAELIDLQNKHGVPLLYEGSACGAIPIIRNLEEYYDNDQLSGLEGICNGTSNYILTKMYDSGDDFQPVLKQAQTLGFAETDPTLDIDGFDAKYKLIILTGHAFGVILKPEEVLNIGIRQISDRDIRFAKEKGFKIRLIARSFRVNSNGKIAVYVMPAFVPTYEPLAQVNDEFNGVQVQAAFAEKQYFIGKGAGSFPTGAAVLSDVGALSYNYAYEYKKLHQEVRLTATNDVEVDVYFRFEADSGLPSELQFSEIYSRYEAKNYQYLTGRISVSQLLTHNERINREKVFICRFPEGYAG